MEFKLKIKNILNPTFRSGVFFLYKVYWCTGGSFVLSRQRSEFDSRIDRKWPISSTEEQIPSKEKVPGSNPGWVSIIKNKNAGVPRWEYDLQNHGQGFECSHLRKRLIISHLSTQLNGRANGFDPLGWEFESLCGYNCYLIVVQ